MNGWRIFWEISLWIAGATFAGITLIVIVRGFSDLRAMFAGLSREKRKE
jgi:hypothetical protein